MPGRKWYAIALLLLVAGGAAAAVVAFTRTAGLAAEIPQIVVPGEAELTFSRPGDYTIFLERESVVNGRIYSTNDDVAGLRVRITSPSGAPIELTQPSASTSYSIAGRSGSAVLACTIPAAGRYRLAAGYPDGRQGPEGVLAIGLGVPGRIIATIFLALGIGFAGFVAAVAVAGVTFWRRRKALRARSAAATASGPATAS